MLPFSHKGFPENIYKCTFFIITKKQKIEHYLSVQIIKESMKLMCNILFALNMVMMFLFII